MTFSLKATFFLILFFLAPLVTSASEIRLDAGKVGVKTGEQFIVDVSVYAKGPINALDGRIVFAPDMLAIKDIRDGNSSINFWVERPHLESPGILVFSGITPGGLSGDNRLFSLVFEAQHTGTAPITIENAHALLNDGAGTPTELILRSAVIAVMAGDSNTRTEPVEQDDVPPEPFTPEIADAPPFLEGTRFIVFATQDKDSGISHYEMKEYKVPSLALFSSWREVESPAVLLDQGLRSHILVRAIDTAGNTRTAEIVPAHPLAWYERALRWIILIGALCTLWCIVSKTWERKDTYKA